MTGHRQRGENALAYLQRLARGGNGEPRVFVWMARGLLALGFWVALQAFAGSTGVVILKFMGRPLLEDMDRRAARRDSIIIAQLGDQIATVGKNQVIQERRINLLAEGLKYPYGSRQRTDTLNELQEQGVLRQPPVRPLDTDHH